MRNVCMWCSRPFEPRSENDPNRYGLISAGTAICWSCADLYDDAQVKLHNGTVYGLLEGMKVKTQSGHCLPISIDKWVRPQRKFIKGLGQAIDVYGKRWSVKANGNQLDLRPARATLM